MPLKLSVGLSRKQGLPHYGSVGASCHLEVELPADILNGEGIPLQQQAELAFDACRQSVYAELQRHAEQPTDAPSDEEEIPDSARMDLGEYRRATSRQLNAIERLLLRIGLNPPDWLAQRLGSLKPQELSIAQASELIDELQGLSHAARFPAMQG